MTENQLFRKPFQKSFLLNAWITGTSNNFFFYCVAEFTVKISFHLKFSFSLTNFLIFLLALSVMSLFWCWNCHYSDTILLRAHIHTAVIFLWCKDWSVFFSLSSRRYWCLLSELFCLGYIFKELSIWL